MILESDAGWLVENSVVEPGREMIFAIIFFSHDTQQRWWWRRRSWSINNSCTKYTHIHTIWIMELQMFSLFANAVPLAAVLSIKSILDTTHNPSSCRSRASDTRKNSTWTQRKKEERKFSFRKFHSGCGGYFICHCPQTLNCFSPRAKFSHFSLCEGILNFFLLIIFSESEKIESVLSKREKRANSNDPMKIPFGCDFMAQLTADSRWSEKSREKNLKRNGFWSLKTSLRSNPDLLSN